MSNKEIYSKTLKFSLIRVLWDIFAFLILGALTAGGFIIAEQTLDKGLAGLLIGLVVGVIFIVVLLRFVSYQYAAGQIAMMTKGVTEGSLPKDVVKEGKAVVKRRFTTVVVYFAVTSAIKAVFRQIGNGITKAGEAIGGDTGSAIGSAISTGISILVAYLCDCCLGWVFYREDEKPVKATLEGGALFFKHGKTLLKNTGRIFGLGLLSLLLIGGVFFGGFYLLALQFPNMFSTLASEISEFAAEAEAELPAALSDPKTLTIICAALAAAIIWRILHAVFVRPFILTGVLRNFIESGVRDMPTEENLLAVAQKSPKFAKLMKEQ